VLPKIPLIEPGERLLARPSWNDAPLMTFANEWTQQDIALIPGSPTTVANPNPKRWAIGFVIARGVAASIFVTPFNDPATFGNVVTDDVFDNWYTIFQFGPFLQQTWYVSTAGVATVRMIEVEIGEFARNDE